MHSLIAPKIETITTFITRCNEQKKESTVEEDSKKEKNEADMNTKEEENMKRESSENPERLLVTSKEAPAYNREVIFSYYSWAHDNF